MASPLDGPVAWRRTVWLAALVLRGGSALAQPETAAAQSDEAPDPAEGSAAAAEHSSGWDGVSIGTLWYLHYVAESSAGNVDRAHISRGYVTLRFRPTDWFGSRITPDTHQDDAGDWVVRLKYLYGQFTVPIETAVLTEPNVELGLVHTPWFDFEEHVDDYRAQGTMFIERNGLLNSADLGFTVGGLLGPKLDAEYRESVSSKYPGRWGSFAFGVYNGGGYHAVEENESKVFESRLSVRPLGFVVPNLQLSHFFVHGHGNTPDTPDWALNDVMASFEHRYFVLTAQYAFGEGNQNGSAVDEASGEALGFRGYSLFAEVKLPWILSSLIGRYDRFEWDVPDGGSTRFIAGYAFHFLDDNFVMLDVDRVSYEEPGRDADWLAKITLQVEYP